MDTRVENATVRSRYEIYADGELAGFADYVVRGDTVVFPHTLVEPARRGQGLAAILVRHALDDVRSAGRCVDAQCWYVARFVDEHAEYADLVA